jgi:hypothetical protein
MGVWDQPGFGGIVRPESDEPTWYRMCESGGCVEIAIQGEFVKFRSSNAPEVIVHLTRSEWQEFLAGARKGFFDEF